MASHPPIPPPGSPMASSWPRRELYRGRIVYGGVTVTGNPGPIDRAGRRVKGRRGEGEGGAPAQPGLRIVPEDLGNAAHARRKKTRLSHTGFRKDNGQLHGSRESVLVSKHLLTGFLRCGVCGGGMFVAPRGTKNGETTLFYLSTSPPKTATNISPHTLAPPH